MKKIVKIGSNKVNKKLSVPSPVSAKGDAFGVFWLCVSFSLFCVSELLLAIDILSTVLFKGAGFMILVLLILYKQRFSKLVMLLPPIILVMLFSFYRSHNANAATEEFVRFLFPLIILLSIYQFRGSLDRLLFFFIIIVISNNIYQLYAYIAYFTGLPTFQGFRLEAGYIIRAQGWVGFFSFFGFMNFCAFILVHHTSLIKKQKRILECSFLIFIVLSTSFKAFVALGVWIALTSKSKSAVKYILLSLIACIIVAVSQPRLVYDFASVLDNKFAFYLTEGNSARSESYRVMLESLTKPNFFGEGLGTFGGPASTKYYSPLYSEYNFDWYGLEGRLATTDTLYPHIFVELGLIGGLAYLIFIFLYGQKNKSLPWFIVVIAFLIDNYASFGMLSPPYFFTAAICMIYFSGGGNSWRPSNLPKNNRPT
ncbi:hypothetical protein [Stutzerimonas xanthomarina]|uniref:hypothetical protein n=1 Tax=Stutzerimonas xanthomarina TaxID=271420 RepID=UPI003AA86570